MCCIIKKIKSWFCPQKQCCNKFEKDLLEKATLSKEEVDNVIINSLKKVKQQKKTKPKAKVQTKIKAKVKNKKSKR